MISFFYIQGLNSWKTERIRLKDLIKSLKSSLNEKSLSLAAIQASLADVLVAKVGHQNYFKLSIEDRCINEYLKGKLYLMFNI